MLTEERTEIRGARRMTYAVACAALALFTCGSALALRQQVDGPQATQGAHALRVRSDIMAGSAVTRVPPTYPPEAKTAKVQGAVVLHAVIGKQGNVESLRVVSGPEPLRQSAVEAVKQWKYKPFLLNGDPVDVSTDITVNYSLNK